ncbi:hypothetical protein [Methylobacterium pseudosasicola]|uniref:hypothetical protein n=1 Tax=Methylobacterium pseudosasicola TaxID=582667 RepID=UPI001114091F|nr:hypothetical protein [Methylobacterium pseudosasicola]
MRQLAPEAEGKRFSIGFRTTKTAKDRIETEAKANGRSVAQEIEYRIDAGYRILDANRAVEKANSVADVLLGDENTAEMLRSFSAVVGAIMAYTGKHWSDDVYTRLAVQSGIEEALWGHFSKEPLDISREEIDLDRASKTQSLGKFYGRMIVAAIRDPAIEAAIEEMSKESSEPNAQAKAQKMVDDILGK